MQNMNGVEQPTPGAPQPIMGQEMPPAVGIMSGAKNMMDAVKGPVFWLAVGYFTCKFLDRKRAIKV